MAKRSTKENYLLAELLVKKVLVTSEGKVRIECVVPSGSLVQGDTIDEVSSKREGRGKEKISRFVEPAFCSSWSPEVKFNKNNFFLIPSLMVNLPDHWQDNFTGADNLKCLTLYPSKDELNPLRRLSRRNKQSISPTV